MRKGAAEDREGERLRSEREVPGGHSGACCWAVRLVLMFPEVRGTGGHTGSGPFGKS